MHNFPLGAFANDVMCVKRDKFENLTNNTRVHNTEL